VGASLRTTALSDPRIPPSGTIRLIMPLYEYSPDRITEIPTTTFAAEKVRERFEIQARLRDQIEIIAPGCYVITEEFADWEDSRRRIDLLCIDKAANLVVIELKRGEDGGAMELQALRYAAMVSKMTFEQAATAHADYLARRGIERNAPQSMLDFLEWSAPEDGRFADEVKIILVAADFSREITTAVMWLNERELDIRCVQMRPYRHGASILIDIEQVIPLKAAEEYQVRVREKRREEERHADTTRDFTKYDVMLDGVVHPRQAKRTAIYLAVRHLCSKGRTPEEVAKSAPWRENKFWRSTVGELDSVEFLRQITADRAREGRVFDPYRWFCAEGELIHAGGRTYALSNQWGERTKELLDDLQRRFPKDGVVVTEARDRS
jgi:hypothetical protein